MYKVASLPELRSRSVSAILSETGLPSFNTILSNCRVVFNKCILYKRNDVLIKHPCGRGLE